jgi:8-oxo-dGTP diphosphatase
VLLQSLCRPPTAIRIGTRTIEVSCKLGTEEARSSQISTVLLQMVNSRHTRNYLLLRLLAVLCVLSLLFETTMALNPSLSAVSTTRHLSCTSTRLCSTTCQQSSSEIKYPRPAVSVAVRCSIDDGAHYLLVKRGKAPNKDKWSFPGGKLELGETALQGGQRELREETQFAQQPDLGWFPGTIATVDSILSNKDGSVAFHFLIAICFAELKDIDVLPETTAADDAADAKWWPLQEILDSEEPTTTPGLLDIVQRAEFLYQKGSL